MPPKARPAPMDKFTDASATAVASGFSAAMALGPQPQNKINSTKSASNRTAAAESRFHNAPVPDPNATEPSAAMQHENSGAAWLSSLRAYSGIKEPRKSSGSAANKNVIAGTEMPSWPLNGDGEGGEGEDSEDEEDDDDDSPAPGKKGGKKGKGKAKKSEEQSAEQRKAQNRIAQREFRQRKQQYIRALEARVELLSSDHDSQVDRLRWALRGLLTENNLLRESLASLAGFIGQEMIGGPLQKRGMTREELEILVNNRSEKTLTTQWQNWPGATECEALQQIRKESNLPPEGLPESHRPGEAQSNGKKGKRKGSAADDEPSPSSAATRSSKRATKGTGDLAHVCTIVAPNAAGPPDLLDANGRPRTSVMERTLGPPPPAPPTSMPPTVPPTAADANAMASNSYLFDAFAGAGANSAFLSQAGLYGLDPGPNGFTTGMTPGANDSDAILASLFGTEQMNAYGAPYGATPTGDVTMHPPNHVSQQQQASTSSSSATPGSTGAAGSPSNLMSGGIVATAHALSLNPTPMAQDAEDVRLNNFINSIIIRANRARQRAGRSDFLPLNLTGMWVDGKPAVLPEIPEAVIKHVDATDSGKYPLGKVRDSEAMERMAEAVTQLQYHMANFRKNPTYRLPPLLKPSELQQSKPHDHIIDGIPFPGIRDLLIQHQDTINMSDVWVYMIEYCDIHEGDHLSSSTWEMELPFYLRFPQLLEPNALDVANKWRASRGESHLSVENVQKLAAQSEMPKGV